MLVTNAGGGKYKLSIDMSKFRGPIDRALSDLERVASATAAVRKFVAELRNKQSVAALESLSTLDAAKSLSAVAAASVLQNVLHGLLDDEEQPAAFTSLVHIAFSDRDQCIRGLAMLTLLELLDDKSKPDAISAFGARASVCVVPYLQLGIEEPDLARDMALSWLCSLDALRKCKELAGRIAELENR
jgi:hypothetical protein